MSNRRAELGIIAGFTVVLSTMLAYSLTQGDSYAYWTEGVCLALLWVPPLLSHRGLIELPYSVLLAIGASLSLHSLGLVTDWYLTTFWWDKVTHLVSGVAVGALVTIALLLVMDAEQAVHVPSKWIPLFVFLAVLSLEAAWEIMEFTLDSTIGTQMQHGILDTVNDIVTNSVSGVVVGVGAAVWVEHSDGEKLRKRLKAEWICRWIEGCTGSGR